MDTITNPRPIIISSTVPVIGTSAITAEDEVDVVNISRVIIAHTLESLSPHTTITHNIQATFHFKKNNRVVNSLENIYYVHC